MKETILNTKFPFSPNLHHYEMIQFGDVGISYANSLSSEWILSNRGITINQYSFQKQRHFPDSLFNSLQVHIAAIFLYLLKTVKIQESSENEVRKKPYSVEPCWLMTVGDNVEKSGRRRIGVGNRKMLGYVFVAMVIWKCSDPSNDWSHLCGNAACIRPSHLFQEKHELNMRRISCPGLLFHPITDEVFCMCSCEPKCKKISVLTQGLPMISYSSE